MSAFTSVYGEKLIGRQIFQSERFCRNTLLFVKQFVYYILRNVVQLLNLLFDVFHLS